MDPADKDTLVKLASAIGGGLLIGITAVWQLIKARITRADKELDDANARTEYHRKREQKFAALWRKEVERSARRAFEPAPRHVPVSLPPPDWNEDTEVRDLRGRIEARVLREEQQEPPRPPMKSKPVVLEAQFESDVPPRPRPRQISVIELDGRKRR